MRVLIVDDEPLARRHLEKLLAREPDVILCGSCRNVREARESLGERRPDAAFVDIEMPGASGLDLARELRNAAVPVVLVTAHPEHAIEAFDADAADYLLKPFDQERFRRAMARVRERVAQRIEPAATEELLPVESNGRIRMIDPATIDWIEADGKRVLLHLGGETVPHRQSLRALAGQLEEKSFIRVHRGALVRMGAIRELYPVLHGDWAVVLHNGQQVPMSRRFRLRLARIPSRSRLS
jgi:two-component system LytT family response regulator